MSQAFKNILSQIESFLRKEHSFAVFFILFILWQIPGIFPLISYEGDGTSVSFGCEYAFSRGWGAIGDRGYGFWMQPLLYWFVSIFKHLLSSFSCEAIYCLLSAACAVSVQYLSIIFASRLSGFRPLTVLAALAFIPESFMLSMYPNSTAVAMLPLLGAFLLLARGGGLRISLALLLLLLAPLIRLDVVIVYPLILPLFIWGGMPWRKALIFSACFALITIAAISGLYRLLGGDILYTLNEFGTWQSKVNWYSNLLAIAGFYGIGGFLLLIVGFCRLIKDRRYFLLLIIAGAMLLVHIVNFRFGNASKHYALLLPFIAAAAAIGVRYVTSCRRRPFFAALITVCVLWLFTGVRLTSGIYSVPNRYVPTVARAAIGPVEITIGGGQAFRTGDEAILLSGEAFYPLYISRLKAEYERRLQLLSESNTFLSDKTVVVHGWEEMSRVLMLCARGECMGLERVFDNDLNYVMGSGMNSNPEAAAEYLRATYNIDGTHVILSTEPINFRNDYLFEVLAGKGVLEPVNDAIYILR